MEKNEEIKVESWRDWSGLPIEMLEVFYQRLTLSDQLRFTSVCKSWFNVSSSYPPAPDTPWLITNCHSDKYELLSLSEDKLYIIHKPPKVIDIDKSLIIGTFKGWLLLQSKVHYHLLNVFSNHHIHLPFRRTVPKFLYYKRGDIDMASARGFALLTCANLNPIIIVLLTYGGDFALCRIGGTAWRGYQSDETYENLIFHNKKLYAMNDKNNIDIFSIDAELQPILVGTIQSSLPILNHRIIVYMLELEGNLVVVRRLLDYRSILRRTIGFEVFKVEENRNPHGVVKLDSLKDLIFFVGDMSAESVAAEHCPGLKGNHIYYTGYSCCGMTSDMGVFSIESSTHKLFIKTGVLIPLRLFFPLWVLPKLALECDINCDCALHNTNST